MKRIRQWMVVVLMLCTFGAQAQETAEMVYPQAEWSKADVDKAAEEHRGYIRMLEANGIRVHTVTGIQPHLAAGPRMSFSTTNFTNFTNWS